MDPGAVQRTVERLRDDPAQAAASFTTTTWWESGARARTVARSFALHTDEPVALGGTDQALDPMELVLAALGTCLMLSWVTHAARRGVTITDLHVEVRGDFDLRGYLGGADVRPGYSGISYTVHVDSPADREILEELRAEAEGASPIRDNVCAGTPISGAVERLDVTGGDEEDRR